MCSCSLLQAHEMPLAEPFESTMTRFQKLLVLRCLRPDRVLAGVRDFVSENLGQRFIEPPPFDLAACFKESSASTPLVFVLSPGTTTQPADYPYAAYRRLLTFSCCLLLVLSQPYHGPGASYMPVTC